MKNEKYAPHPSSIGGVNANVIAFLAYLSVVVFGFIPVLKLVPWVAPLILYMMEKESRFVKFHAMQSLILNIISSALALFFIIIRIIMLGGMVMGGGFFTGLFFGGLLSLIYFAVAMAIFVLAIIVMVKSYNYEEYHIPVIGDIAENQINKSMGMF